MYSLGVLPKVKGFELSAWQQQLTAVYSLEVLQGGRLYLWAVSVCVMACKAAERPLLLGAGGVRAKAVLIPRINPTFTCNSNAAARARAGCSACRHAGNYQSKTAAGSRAINPAMKYSKAYPATRKSQQW